MAFAVELVFDRHRIGGAISPYRLAFSLDASQFSADSQAHPNRGSWVESRIEVRSPIV
jgi:hypothetical protein